MMAWVELLSRYASRIGFAAAPGSNRASQCWPKPLGLMFAPSRDRPGKSSSFRWRSLAARLLFGEQSWAVAICQMRNGS